MGGIELRLNDIEKRLPPALLDLSMSVLFEGIVPSRYLSEGRAESIDKG